jgi:hypothetical protein
MILSSLLKWLTLLIRSFHILTPFLLSSTQPIIDLLEERIKNPPVESGQAFQDHFSSPWGDARRFTIYNAFSPAGLERSGTAKEKY